MTDDEADALISGVVVDSGAALTNDDKRRMAHDAGGSPFVLEQLALYAGTAAAGTRQAPTFGRLLASRVEALSPAGRLFLETLAICGRPVAPDIVCDACGVARDRQSLVMMLRASRLIRSSGSSDRVETYHDRIREVLVDRLRPDRVRDIHTRMAASLVARQSDDCDALFEHYRGAGDDERASTQAGLAAEKAGAALAFDRVRVLLSACPRSGPIRRGGVCVEGRPGRRARECRPSGGSRGRLPARRRRRRTPAAHRTAAPGRGTVPDRRTHRSRPRSEPARARERRLDARVQSARGRGALGVASRTPASQRHGLRPAR